MLSSNLIMPLYSSKFTYLKLGQIGIVEEHSHMQLSKLVWGK